MISGLGRALDLSKLCQRRFTMLGPGASSQEEAIGVHAGLPGSDWRPPGDEMDGRGQGVRLLLRFGPWQPRPIHSNLSAVSEDDGAARATGPCGSFQSSGQSWSSQAPSQPHLLALRLCPTDH